MPRLDSFAAGSCRVVARDTITMVMEKMTHVGYLENEFNPEKVCGGWISPLGLGLTLDCGDWKAKTILNNPGGGGGGCAGEWSIHFGATAVRFQVNAGKLTPYRSPCSFEILQR
jgi:hypothetical protein